MTLADLLQRAVDHIPHHALYIEEKRETMETGTTLVRHILSALECD
jgi:hypothetical protein